MKMIRRLSSHVSHSSILKMVDGLFTSKITYGLQLYGKMRLSTNDWECMEFKSIQMVQNKLLRALNGTKVKDMISTVSLLEKFGMLAVNQLNVQIKLLEIWKSLNVEKYPLTVQQQSTDHSGMATKADQSQRPVEIGKTILTQKSCISDAIRVWNQAPDKIKRCLSISQAKKEIKAFVKTLPVWKIRVQGDDKKIKQKDNLLFTKI